MSELAASPKTMDSAGGTIEAAKKPLVRAWQLGKRYKLYDNPYARLAEWGSFGSTIRHRDFWACGMSGWNCAGVNVLASSGAMAGKSTLLRLLSGTLAPPPADSKSPGRSSHCWNWARVSMRN